MWDCVLCSKVYIYTCSEFSGLAHRQGNYGVSLYSCCERVSMPPFNCPPMLTSSWTSQFLSNMLDKSLVVFWFGRSNAHNCHSGQQLLWARPVEHKQRQTHLVQQNQSSYHPFCYIGSVLFCILVFAHHQYYLSDLET